MPGLKVSMIGAGSGFVISIARELVLSPVFEGCTFVMMDINPKRLAIAEREVKKILERHKSDIRVVTTTRHSAALEGANYVITSCELNRWAFWLKDVKIPERHGVFQVLGENGGPGGQIHALRNIGLLGKIAGMMEQYCPRAWLMNFTNPMSYLCTYLNKYTKIKTLGFCHQVHGSFGVIAEQLGMEPGDLEVITGGVNHFNWLFDIRRRGTNRSCMKEFLRKVKKSKYWRRKHDVVPRQEFTLEILKTFGAYPVGFDDHIIEYTPFFYGRDEWEKYGYHSCEKSMKKLLANEKTGFTLEAMTIQSKGVKHPPFPRDEHHPYYAEHPCQVIEALETNKPTYFDAINIVNHGSIGNLPADAIVDVPALAVGGEVRGVHIGNLPLAAMELCRRQITLHEMIAKAAYEGDANLFLQALCLDPYVRSITQARAIWKDFLKEYRDHLPMFNLKKVID